jgi:Mg2+ and Co2+ transporter CorA
MGFQFKLYTADDRENIARELEEQYNVTDLDVEDVTTNTQLSKLEKRKEYLYVALQFPDLRKFTFLFLKKD